MDSRKIGEFLKALRKSKGMTQEEVASTLYLSPKTISRWESGLGIPDINIISGVASLYGVTVDEILQGTKKSIKEEQLSEATIRFKEKNMSKILVNNILAKLNKYFIVALSIEGAFLLLELLIGLLLNEFASVVLMPIGLIISIVIMIVGNNEIKHRLDEEDDFQINKNILDVGREIRRKNVLFADVTFGFVAITILLLVIFLV